MIRLGQRVDFSEQPLASVRVGERAGKVSARAECITLGGWIGVGSGVSGPGCGAVARG